MTEDAIARECCIRELANHGLIARFVPGEDESVDDGIDVWVREGDREVEVGSIQITQDRHFIANVWLDAETMQHGIEREQISAAMHDLVVMLIKAGRDDVPTRAQLAFDDFDDVDSVRRLIRDDWFDASWRNDTCPHFTKDRADIWIDFVDPKLSERAAVEKNHDGERHRFLVYEINEQGEFVRPGDGDPVGCNTLDDALEAAAKINSSPPFQPPT